jgi:sialic acid synthase SpsE
MFFEIGGRPIGQGEALFVIAELGLNHGGSVDRALELVDAAAAAGASAVKLQTFQADELVAAACPAPAHVSDASLRAFFKRFELDKAAHAVIAKRARSHGLAFMATPFSTGAVDLLEDVGIDAFKIASGDLTYHALIERCARTGRPIVISTGMSTLAETTQAVSRARAAGGRFLALLHCVSSYPVPDGSQNLRAVQTLGRIFGTPVGLSDHAADTSAVPIAVALGASIYERHLMLPGDDGVDRAVSSSPEELADVVATARKTQTALGHGRRECSPAEAVNLTASRRALHASRALASGHAITPDDIAVLRPARGLPPGLEHELVGSVLARTVEAGAPFFSADLSSCRSQRGVA